MDLDLLEKMMAHANRVIPQEELEANAEREFEPNLGVNFKDWNDVLVKNTYPFKLVPISREDIRILTQDNPQATNVSNKLKEDLQSALKELKCENSFFIKLITRSPKDFLDGNFELTNIEDALKALSCSMRTFEDLCVLLNLTSDYLYIVVRPFIEIRKETEFRVLVDENNVSITQYYCEKHEYFITDTAKLIEERIRKFIKPIFI